jgi:hypothetical protein
LKATSQKKVKSEKHVKTMKLGVVWRITARQMTYKFPGGVADDEGQLGFVATGSREVARCL